MIDIRKYYTPIQPSVKVSLGDVTYTEFLPDVSLQPYIYCYWQLSRTDQFSEIFNYRVVADGCIDIFFELGGSFECYVMGFCKQFTAFPLQGSFNYIGIRFFPSVFSQLFGINSKTLSDKTTTLTNILPEIAAFISENINPEQDHYQICEALDIIFFKVLSESIFSDDKRFYKALQRIFESKGMIDVDQELDTGLSSRQLRRHFEYFVGATAKTLSRVVRFQAVLKEVQGVNANIFLSLGYYDQSHFIKEFKTFYGMTPHKTV